MVTKAQADRGVRSAYVLLTVEEVAELLKVKVSTIYVWTSSRKIPFRKVGGLLRFDLDEILEWTKTEKK